MQDHIGQSLGTVCCSDRPTAFYKIPFSLISPYILRPVCFKQPHAFCVTRYIKCVKPLFAKGRTRTVLGLQRAGFIPPPVIPRQSIGKSVPAGRLTLLFINLSFSNGFPLNPSPLPCDLRNRIFRKGNRRLQSCQCRHTAANDT